MSLATIDNDQIWEIILTDSLERTTDHYFQVGCKIINHTILESFDLIFFISFWIWFSIHYYYSTRIGKVTIRMRYIITFEDDLSFFWNWISDSLEHIHHMIPSQYFIFESSKFPFIGVFAELIPSEIKEFLFWSDFWYLKLNMKKAEKIPKCTISDITCKKKYSRNIILIEILSHQK